MLTSLLTDCTPNLRTIKPPTLYQFSHIICFHPKKKIMLSKLIMWLQGTNKYLQHNARGIEDGTDFLLLPYELKKPSKPAFE